MNKIATLLTVIVAASFLSIKITESEFDEPRNTWAEEQRIQELVTSYSCFRQSLYETIDELKMGEIPLKKAQTRILSAARRYHPDFFAQIVVSEQGNTDEERVAHNLVEHVESFQEYEPQLRMRMPALRAELQELVDEIHDKKLSQ